MKHKAIKVGWLIAVKSLTHAASKQVCADMSKIAAIACRWEYCALVFPQGATLELQSQQKQSGAHACHVCTVCDHQHTGVQRDMDLCNHETTYWKVKCALAVPCYVLLAMYSTMIMVPSFRQPFRENLTVTCKAGGPTLSATSRQCSIANVVAKSLGGSTPCMWINNIYPNSCSCSCMQC